MKKLLTALICSMTLNASAKVITTQEFANSFKNYDACFMLYDLNTNKVVSEYNPNGRCGERIAPNSTFKIPLSLMGFNQGLINQNTVFKWDGKSGELTSWNQDQTPNSWLKNSVLWVSQQISTQLGHDAIKSYLANFSYGNQDFTGDPGKNNGITHAWLASSLKISAVEQLNFLKAMLTNQLALRKEAIADTKHNMYLGQLDNGAAYYGKTGSGRHGRNERLENPSKLRDGWFVGFIENNNEKYIFVSNLTDKHIPEPSDKAYGSQLLKPITLAFLNQYFTNQE
ncbi:MAG: class D beta-lactamase [Proteobacteria bacterium]|nr:class D beta-lactamase [Pseudomonadota bacterium]